MNRAKIFFLSQFLVVIFLWIAFSIFWLPNFWNNSVDDRIIEDDWEEVSFTWAVIYEVPEEKWKFLFENLSWNEFISFSKDYDLNNFLWELVFINWEEFFSWTWFKDLEIKKISIIEQKIFEEPKKFFLENKFWWYWFEVDENIFTSVKWWSKTFMKNWSWETILKFFSYDFAWNWNFFSEWWNSTSLNWFEWEIKSLENWQEIFLKNPEGSYWVLIQIDYWIDFENLEKTKKEVYNFLQNFKFIEKENISKEKCWWKENLVCEEWYFCELFSTYEKASWRCVEL